MWRLSGPARFRSRRNLRLIEAHRTTKPRPIRTCHDPLRRDVDEVLLTSFKKAPRSYNGEDVVEVSCPAPIILARVLQMAIERGARVAEPGEFTFRAFFNKRIDLAQAQAVRGVINAQTQYQARVATKQLEGELSLRLTPLKDALVEVIVHLESSVEFVEDDISPETASALLAKLAGVIDALTVIANSFTFGRYVKEGFDLAIVGRLTSGSHRCSTGLSARTSDSDRDARGLQGRVV